MYSKVLRQLEVLQADLERIDPARESDASDKVAEMAVALRRLMRRVATPDDLAAPETSLATTGQAAG